MIEGNIVGPRSATEKSGILWAGAMLIRVQVSISSPQVGCKCLSTNSIRSQQPGQRQVMGRLGQHVV